MADTIEEKIFRALILRMAEFPLPTGWVVADRVAMPGIDFDVPTEVIGGVTLPAPFLSIEFHFNRSIETDLSLKLDPIRQGFMRVNVMWPKGRGVFQAIDLAGKVRTFFKRGTRVTFEGNRTDVNEDPEIANMVTGDTHISVPVTIRWTCQPQVPA